MMNPRRLALVAATCALALPLLPLPEYVVNLANLAGIAALVALGLIMHLGDEWAGSVNHRQIAQSRFILQLLRYSMRREYGNRPIGNFLDRIDENNALGAQIFHHPAVMHDLVPHVNRRAVERQRCFHDLDGAIDACAKSARRSE